MFSEPLLSVKSVLLLVGVIHGCVLLGTLLFRKKRLQQQQRVLCFLLFVLIVIVLEHAYQYSALYRLWPEYLYTSSAFYFLIGPSFYFYLKSFAKPDWRLEKRDVFHLLPFLYFVYFMWPQYTYPRENMISFADAFFAGTIDVSSNYWTVLIAYKAHFIVYLVLSHRLVGDFISEYKRQLANAAVERVDQLFPILMYLNIYFFFSLASTFFINLNREFYLIADFINLLLLSGFLHLASYFSIRQYGELPRVEHVKYEKSKIDAADMAALKAQVETAMETDKLYLNQQLKLADFAASLSLSPHQLSQVLNDGFGLSFYDFVNSHRVTAAKRLLHAETHQHFSLNAIAEETGFNSYVSFYRVFKKHAGKTPSAWQKSTLQSLG